MEIEFLTEVFQRDYEHAGEFQNVFMKQCVVV